MSYLDAPANRRPQTTPTLDAPMPDAAAVTITTLPRSVQDPPSTPEMFNDEVRASSTPHEVVELDTTVASEADESILHDAQLLHNTTPASTN